MPLLINFGLLRKIAMIGFHLDFCLVRGKRLKPKILNDLDCQVQVNSHNELYCVIVANM